MYVFAKGEHLWNNNERRMQFEQVAEGSVTLDEFVAQLSDEELAHLLGGQPNYWCCKYIWLW